MCDRAPLFDLISFSLRLVDQQIGQNYPLCNAPYLDYRCKIFLKEQYYSKYSQIVLIGFTN